MNQSGDKPGGTSQLVIPEVEIGKVLGLIEVLKMKDGRADIYKLATELSMEFGDTLAVVRGAELLKLVHTPGGDVVLEPLGEKVTKARINQKKIIISEQMLKLDVFQRIRDFLREKEGHEAAREEVLEKLAELLPNENAENTFANVVNWGRWAELFGYNDDSQSFYLDTGEAS
ncbi:MAG: AAA-associated domain-containing protein [Bacteriovoracia bacterium]